jgi:hypothetical protein
VATESPAKRHRYPGEPPSLKAVSKAGKQMPNRAILYATPGWGKSSIGCHVPDAIFLMTREEDGLLQLLDRGLVPPAAHFEGDAKTWNEIKMAVSELKVQKHDHKVLIIDTLNGAERLCVEDVTDKEFGGSADKFQAYGKGVDAVVTEWVKFLTSLSELRDKGIGTLLLAHSKIATFKNPEGADLDRYVPDMLPKVWAQTEKWADMVLFGQLETFVKLDKGGDKKGKAAGGQNRVLYCERTAVADAKNRHGLPAEVLCGVGADKAWAALAKALAEGRKTAPQDAQAPETQEDAA